ncbi:hypothetical protein BGZ60DRAFT_491677 [Tricladium varicosporioides]|nr:hypothetical protein BGZ60DRAFT_491677 [Hymenoscyphus varicosporioides]
MRLLKLNASGELSLSEFLGYNIPPYAILSHTWGADSEEVTFKDLLDNTGKKKAGYAKIQFCGEQAAIDDIQYFWVDTCCIDKSSSAELAEAINSMFRWYREAAKCYVYLSDVSIQDLSQSAFRKSRWFTRGWTLQELIAPTLVEFFSLEGKRLGDKGSMEKQVHEITKIAIRALRGDPLSDFSVADRMSWAANRETTREEDKAYCLLGIFDIYMPLLYGEGNKAFIRLNKEIKESMKASQADNLPIASSTMPFRRDPDFVDRGTILDQIKQKCEVPGSRTALVGLGGIGKSQLAIEYSYRVRDRSPSTWVFWVHASNAARFEQSYRQIADRVKIPGRDDPKTDIIKLVYDWLQNGNKQKWFLILDNFDDAAFLVEALSASPTAQKNSQPLSAYLPQGENGSILVTSRTRDAALTLLEERDIIIVDSMDTIDAVSLFQNKLGVLGDSEDISNIVAVLEFMPLAIVQAAAYIAQKAPRCSVRQYMEKFQRNDEEKSSLLNYEGGHLRRDWEANNSILITWQLSFDHVRQTRPSAAELLSLMSFFDRQGIPEALIRHQDTIGDKDKNHRIYERTDESDDDEFENDITVLRHHSFISIGVDGRTFEMHGLIQLAMRKWLEKHGQLEWWRQKYIRKLFEEFPTGEHENWQKCSALFPHVKGAITQKPQGGDSIEEWSMLLYNAAWYTWKRGVIADAEAFSVKSMNARSKLFGLDHVRTLDSMAMVGLVYGLGGRWKEAENLEAQAEDMGVQVMGARKKVLGQEHPNTLTSMANLTSTYYSQGRLKEAEDLDLQVIEATKRVLGHEHPHTLTSMANLASTYHSQGRLKEAEELDLQVMEATKRVLGREHPDTLTSMANLASAYHSQGRLKEAEELDLQVMEATRRVLGREHPDTLTSMGNLASAYYGQGRLKEAEDLNVHVIEATRRVLGHEHPNTLTSMANLASTYHSQGLLKEAEDLNVQVMETRKRVLGREHPDTLTSMANLASTYNSQGRLKEAEDLEVQLMEARKRV